MLLNRLSKKHFTTTAPLLVLVAILIATLFITPVSAASDYDDIVDIVTEADIGDGDTSLTWYSLFVENCNENFSDGLTTAIQGDGSWSVTLGFHETGPTRLQVLVKESGQGVLSWPSVNAASMQGSEYDHYAYLQWNGSEYDCISQTFTSTTRAIATREGALTSCVGRTTEAGCKLLLSNFDPNYPSGYEGEEIPDNFIVNSKHYIDISYQVNNTRITANYTGNLDNIFGDDLYRIEYKLFNADDPEDLWQLDFADTFCGEAPPPLAPTQDTSLYCQFEYDVGHEGEYALMVFPFISDNFEEPHEAKPRFVTIVIDGSTYSGTTTDMDCDGEGMCLGAPTFEDCDLADLGCHFRNFTKSLQMLLSMLFIPKSGFITGIIADFRNVFETSLGFLAQPVLFILDLLATAVSGTSNTECSYSFPNYFNNPLNITFCTLEDEFPTQWELIKNFIRAFSAFGLLAILHRKYINVISEGVAR